MSGEPDDFEQTRKEVIKAVRDMADLLGEQQALYLATAAQHTSTGTFCRACEESLAGVWRSNEGTARAGAIKDARVFWKETFRYFAVTHLHGGGLVIRQIGSSGNFRCTVTQRARQSELWERMLLLAWDMDMDTDDTDEIEHWRDRALRIERPGRQRHAITQSSRDPGAARAANARHRAGG